MVLSSGRTDEFIAGQEPHCQDEKIAPTKVNLGDSNHPEAEARDSKHSLAFGALMCDTPQEITNGDLGCEPCDDFRGVASLCLEIREQQQQTMQQIQSDRHNTHEIWKQLEVLQNLCHDTAAMGMQHATAVLSLGVRMDVLEQQVSHLLDAPGQVTSNSMTAEAEPNSRKDSNVLQQYAETALKVSSHVSSIETRMDQLESRIGAEVQRAFCELGIKPSSKRVHGATLHREKDQVPILRSSQPAAVLQFGPMASRRSSSLDPPGSQHQSVGTLSPGAGVFREAMAANRSVASSDFGHQQVTSQRVSHSPGVRRRQSQPSETRSLKRRSCPPRMRSVSIPVHRPGAQEVQVGQVTGKRDGERSPIAQGRVSLPLPSGSVSLPLPTAPSVASAGALDSCTEQGRALGSGQQLTAKVLGSTASLLSSIRGRPNDSPRLVGRLSLGSRTSSAALMASVTSSASMTAPVHGGDSLDTHRSGLTTHRSLLDSPRSALDTHRSLLDSHGSVLCSDSVQRHAQAQPQHTLATWRAASPRVPPRIQSHAARILSSEGHTTGSIVAPSQKATPSQMSRMVPPSMRMQSLSVPVHKVATDVLSKTQMTEVTIATLESVSAISGPRAASEFSTSPSARCATQVRNTSASADTPPRNNVRNLQECWAVEAVPPAVPAQRVGLFAAPTPKSSPRSAVH